MTMQRGLAHWMARLAASATPRTAGSTRSASWWLPPAERPRQRRYGMWTAELDDRLLSLVKQHGVMDTRTKRQRQMAWGRVVDDMRANMSQPGAYRRWAVLMQRRLDERDGMRQTRPFTTAEDARLRKLLLRYGNRWSVIAGNMNISKVDARRRFMAVHRHAVLPDHEWTPREDRLLLKLSREHGHNWHVIARLMGPGFTVMMLQLRTVFLRTGMTSNELDDRFVLVDGNDRDRLEGSEEDGLEEEEKKEEEEEDEDDFEVSEEEEEMVGEDEEEEDDDALTVDEEGEEDGEGEDGGPSSKEDPRYPYDNVFTADDDRILKDIIQRVGLDWYVVRQEFARQSRRDVRFAELRTRYLTKLRFEMTADDIPSRFPKTHLESLSGHLQFQSDMARKLSLLQKQLDLIQIRMDQEQAMAEASSK